MPFHASLADLTSTLPTHCSFEYLLHILCEYCAGCVFFRNVSMLHIHEAPGALLQTLTQETLCREEERLVVKFKFEIKCSS